jgi:transcriptional regulator with XRE-family HTH domain
LKELRIAAGFASMDSAAAATGLSRATISRIESAKQVILPRTIRLLGPIYGVGSPALDHLLRLAEESTPHHDVDDVGVPEWYQRYLGEESDAIGLSTYQAECVPSLLRTADYDRAVRSAGSPGLSAEELDLAVAAVVRRQDRLAGMTFHAVLNEAVLHRQVGGPAVLAAQLDHLLAATDLPNVTIQVLPFTSGAHPAMAGAFTMLHFPPGTDVATVFVEVDDHGLYRDRPDHFERYSWIFDRLCGQALDPAASRVLLTHLAQALQRVN